ncbi:MAG: DUF349 domain-containing protein [Bacteroidales bacterium]
MENNDLQNLELSDSIKINQDMKNENVEMSESTTDQYMQDAGIIEISTDTSTLESELQTELTEKSLAETKQFVEKIAQTHNPETEQEYNLLSREQLVAMLEETVNAEDVSSIRAKVAMIKISLLKKEKEEKDIQLNNFLANGGKKEDYQAAPDPLNERFNAAFNIYKEKKSRFNEELERQKQENLVHKLQILDDIKHLIESEEELKKTYDAFKSLQERWKEIGLVPKTEINNLWQNYNFLVEKFFDKVKINKELKDLDLKKNLEAEIELCEKTEELLLETSITKSFRQLQKYHKMWREIGPVPQDKKDEIWSRFRNTTEKLNERRREYYDNLSIEQEKNIETKQALCEKAEQIAELVIDTTKEWQGQTTILNDLLNAWKTIGAAPKKQNDELWIRFKTAIDLFFNNKKEFFGKLKNEQVNNYNEKLNLCIQAEAIKTSNEWKRTTEDFIRLQQEWKKIGPVPKKYSDKIWNRFRAACDEFFNNRSSYFSNIDSIEEENLKLKNELIQQVKGYQFGEDNNENLKIIKDFQRKWMEIGHVPIKFKNDLHIEFREAINANLDKLKISPVEKNTIGFKSKFEAIAHTPGANQAISKEKSFIITKINSMKNDIKLWENNIGFFANSKNANLLKEEFLKKIENAKEDIKVLEEKLKFLQEVK